MKKRLLVWWIIGAVCASVGMPPRPAAAAAGAFRANYDVSYAIAPSGVTIVTTNVTLVNQKTNLYPKQYAIVLDSLRVRNVIARDDGGTITPTITQKDGKTEIALPLHTQNVGLGKETTFTLRYENLDIAQQHGSIWEVNIPGITEDADLGDYTVSVQTPPTFGALQYLKPPPADGTRWNRTQMTRGGISAAYGKAQYAKLTLRYYVENPGLTARTQEIALPPNLPYQMVSIDALSPKPEQIRKDEDGNWLAQYTLSGGQKLSIEATVSVAITLPKESKEEVDLTPYLAPRTYWEADHPAIKELAARLRTPRAIYDYVVATLAYDYDRVKTTPKRKGAASALQTPRQSLCMEFTDLFIAIARAAGIPARELVGYAYTTNTKLRPLSLVSDVLHAWPEYYDATRKMWIPVDPTWGNTTGGIDYFDTFDFNHIVFAIHGRSSEQPLPAGFYREGGREGKDVLVEFLQSPAAPASVTLIPRVTFPKTVTAGFTARGVVTVENASGIEASDISITVETSPFPYTVAKEHQTVAPYSRLEIPLSVSVPSSQPRGRATITVTAADRTVTHAFDVRPISWLYLSVSGMIASTGVLLWVALARPFSGKKRTA